MRQAVNIAAIKDKHLLLVKKRKTWILPGGKPKPGETDQECLKREIKEELPGLKVVSVKFYKTFEGKTPYRGDAIEVNVYLAKTTGKFKPSAEISEARWVRETNKYNLSESTQKIINSLREDGLM